MIQKENSKLYVENYLEESLTKSLNPELLNTVAKEKLFLSGQTLKKSITISKVNPQSSL